jgi:hypothetical protein
MAVELRCPECRAKLRLPVTPEPDSEIECPKCGHVFPTDEHVVHAGAADENDKGDDKPRKKAAEGDDQDKPKKKKKKAGSEAKKGDSTEKPKKSKRKKLKKKKTNTTVLVLAIVGGLMVLGCFVGAIVWFFNRKSASMEMMLYLPDDCDEVVGVNLGHLQKYPEFYKSCESTFVNAGFKKAADAFSKALGQETNDTVDYVVQGTGRSGGTPTGGLVEATVLRTKEKYDTSLLSKLPGAKDYMQDGVKYYTIDDIAELGYPGLRVFAPTDRLVVFCRGDMPDKTFRKMLTGNKDDPDSTAFNRSGQLGKQVIRGTVWKFTVYGRSMPKMPPREVAGGVPQGGAPGVGGGMPQESDEDLLRKEIAEILSSAQGGGVKASVGSREIRCEWIVWYKDSETAGEMLKKWKEKEWVKDEEKDPPRWWKSVASRSGGGKTAANIIRDGLAFRQSGETFIVRSSMETKVVSASSLVSALGSQTPNPGGGGKLGGGMPGPPGGRQRRRFFLARR